MTGYKTPSPICTRWFSVHNGGPYRSISFDVVAQFRARIEGNHGATLEELHATGGLDFYELWCGFNDRPLFPSFPIDIETARAQVLAIVAWRSA